MTEILSYEVSILKLIDATPPDYHPDYKWREKEEKTINELLSQSITPESKIKRIESYILNQKNDSHNIPAMLIHHTTEYYTHKEYEELHPEIKVYKNTSKELTELSQLREKHKCLITDRVNKIGVLSYYEEIKDDVFNYEKFMLPDNMRLLDFLYQEYKIYKTDTINYLAIMEPKTEKKNSKKEPVKEYTLEFNDRMKTDLQKCCNANLATWDGIGKPDFKNKTLLVALINYWRHSIMDIEVLHDSRNKHSFINDSFTVNNENPKIGKNYLTGKQCENYFESSLIELQEILKFSNDLKNKIIGDFFSEK